MDSEQHICCKDANPQGQQMNNHKQSRILRQRKKQIETIHLKLNELIQTGLLHINQKWITGSIFQIIAEEVKCSTSNRFRPKCTYVMNESNVKISQRSQIKTKVEINLDKILSLPNKLLNDIKTSHFEHFSIGMELSQTDQSQEATNYYNNARKSQLNNNFYYHYRGIFLIRLKIFEEVIDRYKKIFISPFNIVHYNYKGIFMFLRQANYYN